MTSQPYGRWDEPDVLIIGAGLSGLSVAIKLKAAGWNNFVILDKAEECGGVWLYNTYPGCSCDVTSFMYSLSYAPNRNWTRMYASQSEILTYINSLVDDFSLRSHMRFKCEVVSYRFDEHADRWRLRTRAGDEYRPRVIIAGNGVLHKPNIPNFKGRDRFAGPAFHSAQWDHTVDLTGKRIAVIGTGSSSVQFIPEIVKNAAHVDVFQRSPHWALPRLDRALTRTEKCVFSLFPITQKVYRYFAFWIQELPVIGFMHPRYLKIVEFASRRLLKKQVTDPELRSKLTPSYTIGCKRVMVTSDYYPALQQSNVNLITDAVQEITEAGIKTADGYLHNVDVIIYGTGFDTNNRLSSENIVGRGGLTITEAWRSGMEAYMGTAVAGFPNFFLMMGPNSGGGSQSILFVIEAQAHYIVKCLSHMRRRKASRIEIRRDVQQEFNAHIHGKLRQTVWNSGGCHSWFLDRYGNNRQCWPGFGSEYWLKTRRPNVQHFELTTQIVPTAKAL